MDRYGIRQAANGRWQVFDRLHVNQRCVVSYGDKAKAERSAALRNRI